MDHMIGKGWRDLFDVVITQARKPSFYHQQASRWVLCCFQVETCKFNFYFRQTNNYSYPFGQREEWRLQWLPTAGFSN